MTQEKILVAVAWPYANNHLHMGHIAGVYLPADIFTRFHRLNGNDVLMVSGSDAHGTPITVSAEKEKVTPRDILNRYHESILTTWQKFGISFDLYTHTATENHRDVVHLLFKKHREKKAIYKDTQKMLFDPEVKRFLPDRYVEGTCPFCASPEARGDQCDNCGKTFDATQLKNPKSKLTGSTNLEVRETEHFFFDLGKYNDELLEWLKTDKNHWRSQVLNFSKSQLESKELHGRPITRDMNWGIDIPESGFEGKVFYVWYEAVIGYLSATIEYFKHAKKDNDWKKFWTDSSAKSFYFLGKDNIFFHTIMWPSMLKAYGDLNLPYDVPAYEYLNIGGKKLSKSRGGAIFANDTLEKFQADAWRYALSAVAPESADTDFTWEDFQERVNSELIANWGNLANRILGFASKRFDNKVPNPGELQDVDKKLLDEVRGGFKTVADLIRQVKLRAALQENLRLSTKVNQYLSDFAPWTLIKTDAKAAERVSFVALQCVYWLATLWSPFLPESSENIRATFGKNEKLFGEIVRKKISDQKGEYSIVQYQELGSKNHWQAENISAGTTFGEVKPLFRKIMPEDLPESSSQ